MGVRFLCVAAGAFSILLGCGSPQNLQEKTRFTRLDSLTDTYLVLQDSVLQSWNRVVRVETEKSKTLAGMIDEIARNGVEASVVKSLQTQLDQLEKIRFSASTLSNPHVVNEYDQACESLFQAIFQLAQSKVEMVSARGFQKQLEWIYSMKELTLKQRFYYDSLALRFNTFVENNQADLKEMERNGVLELKPLFKADTAER